MPEPRPRPVGPPGPALRPCAVAPRAALPHDPAGRMFVRSLAPVFRRLPLLGSAAAAWGPGGRSRLASALLDAAPWAVPLADALDVQLALRAASGDTWIGWRPLCLVGPTGSGKSWLARQVSLLAGTAAATLDVGGGHVRPFEGRLLPVRAASLPVRVIAATRAANPVIVLDGVERIATRADWALQADALRAMFTADCSRAYFDAGLQQEVDVSQVCWLATCAEEAWLPAEVAARVHVVRVAAPGPSHLPAVVASLVASECAHAGVDPRMVPGVPARAMDLLSTAYDRRPSLWSLRRAVASVVAATLLDEFAHAH